VTVASYWQLPERLLDDPDELAQWARVALAAAERAALTKRGKTKTSVKKPAKKAIAKKPAAKRARRGAQAT
jgi:DNA transformation protein